MFGAGETGDRGTGPPRAPEIPSPGGPGGPDTLKNGHFWPLLYRCSAIISFINILWVLFLGGPRMPDSPTPNSFHQVCVY